MTTLSLSFEFRPNEIILDFEPGAISALKFKFFQSGLIGCFFIFGQFRNFCNFGLEADYFKDKELKS